MLSSHLVHDLERVCDFLIVLAASRTLLAAEVDDVLATHRILTAPRRDTSAIEREHVVLRRETTARQVTLWTRLSGPMNDPSWQVDELSLEDVVLAYLGADAQAPELRRGGVMTWLLWRQHRLQGAVTSGLLAVLAILLADHRHHDGQ